MAKKEFKAESKRLLDLMVNSIYTHKDIFLRELISNSSDAIDKIYYKALTDEDITFNKDDYYIKIETDKENRTITVKDTGIGMSKQELEDNLGTIASSGSFNFKKENDIKDGFDIIGQFGVGFYSAFMVADRLTVKSRTFGEDSGYKWESDGSEGYTLEEVEKDDIGTEIVLKVKESTEDEDYDRFLEEDTIIELVKKYSDFIRYPIKMDIREERLKEGSEDDYEEYIEEKTVNNMVPIWKKNKNELTEEDYDNFYNEKHYGFDKPLKSIHLSIDGLVRYNAILYIPSKPPYDFYTKEYEKGLELYSSGVMIMEKASELLPDHFNFVKGVVDSEDLSLNISREMLQHDRQLRLMAKKIEEKIKDELLNLLENDRERYEDFFKNFGTNIKYGIYSSYGTNRAMLEDLLMFYSSNEKKMTTLDEYIERMPEDQKYIYYGTGETVDRIDKMPQTERVKDEGYEILYLTEDVDEFTIKMLQEYEEIEFKSISSGDLGIESEEKNEEIESEIEENKDLFSSMREVLDGKVKEIKPSKRLKENPVCLASDGEVSIEMEKILGQMPDGESIKADKVLEINVDHNVYSRLKDAFENDKEKFNLYTKLLYNQALLIEGLPIEDPVEFTNNIWKLM